MKIPAPRSPRRLLALVALALALPAFATIWTRSTNVVRVARGARTPIPNAAYVTRDWNVALTGFEVDEGSAAGEQVSPKWLFYYRNTDAEPHYVAITVQCQDTARRERARFTYTATLRAGQKEEASVEVVAKLRSEDWRATQFARVTIDFLSTPSG